MSSNSNDYGGLNTGPGWVPMDKNIWMWWNAVPTHFKVCAGYNDDGCWIWIEEGIHAIRTI